MADEAEVAAVAALAEGPGTDEINVVQIAVVDDVAVAEHRPEALQDAVLGELVLVEALQALEVVDVGRIVLVPGVLPALAGAVLEAQRDDLLHHREEASQPRHLPEGLRGEGSPHVGGDQLEGLLLGLSVPAERLVDCDRGKDVAEMAVIALVLVIAFLLDELGHPGERVFLLLFRQFPEQDGVTAVQDHGQWFVGFLHHFWAVAASQCLDSSRWMVTFLKPAAVRCVFSSSGV